MEKKNNNGILIGLLIGIIVMLLVFVGLFVTNTINFSNNEVNEIDKTQADSNISETNSYIGEYTYTNTDDGITYTATIDLMADGTFYTSEAATMKNFYYGTYRINGNKLVLTHLFNTSNVSGMGNKINNVITYTIKEDGKISTSKNKELVFPSNNDIILSKVSNDCTVAKDFMDILTTMYIGLQEEYEKTTHNN